MKIDSETAELEFSRLCESWDIERVEDDPEYDRLKSTVVRAIQKGVVTIDEECNLKVTFAYEGSLGAVTLDPAKARMGVIDQYKSDQNFMRMMALLGTMCGEAPKMLARCDVRDTKLLMAIGALFLGG
jgi:hypothetical protein